MSLRRNCIRHHSLHCGNAWPVLIHSLLCVSSPDLTVPRVRRTYRLGVLIGSPYFRPAGRKYAEPIGTPNPGTVKSGGPFACCIYVCGGHTVFASTNKCSAP